MFTTYSLIVYQNAFINALQLDFRLVTIQSICRRQIKCAKRQNLRLNLIESFCRGQNNCDSKNRSLLWEGQNTFWEGENVSNQHFLLFLQCFQKGTYAGWLKFGW